MNTKTTQELYYFKAKSLDELMTDVIVNLDDIPEAVRRLVLFIENDVPRSTNSNRNTEFHKAATAFLREVNKLYGL